MDSVCITPSSLKGSLVIPSSKSQTMRAIVFASLADGTCKIENILSSPDIDHMINAVRSLGALVKKTHTSLEITGVSGKPTPTREVIECGNSGLVLRFIGALAGLIKERTRLRGDHSLCYNRSITPLVKGMSELGAFAAFSPDTGLTIQGPFTQSQATLEGQDSQPVSGLLLATAFAPFPITLSVIHPGEKPFVAMTLNWFKRCQILYKQKGYQEYHLFGKAKISPFTYHVLGDLSSLAFPVAAALVTASELTCHNVDLSDCQGDKKLLSILEQMGACFTIDKLAKTLTVHGNTLLTGRTIDVNDCIDALPILAVIGCFAKGKTKLLNGAIARKKESDRIYAMAHELKKMKANIEETKDGLLIYPSSLQGAKLYSHQDHRVALALSVAALAAKGQSVIEGTKWITKTYPSFYQDLIQLGANIDL